MNDPLEKEIAVISQQITQINEKFAGLTKSYGVLNDSHRQLDRHFTIMSTEWRIAQRIIMYLFGGSLLTFIISLITLLRMYELI